jgi:dihydroxy-acid dehydratase
VNNNNIAVAVPLSVQVPFICDLKPSGKYVMEDVHKVGGTPALLKYLLAQGFIDGTCMTVTGEGQ